MDLPLDILLESEVPKGKIIKGTFAFWPHTNEICFAFDLRILIAIPLYRQWKRDSPYFNRSS